MLASKGKIMQSEVWVLVREFSFKARANIISNTQRRSPDLITKIPSLLSYVLKIIHVDFIETDEFISD